MGTAFERLFCIQNDGLFFFMHYMIIRLIHDNVLRVPKTIMWQGALMHLDREKEIGHTNQLKGLLSWGRGGSALTIGQFWYPECYKTEATSAEPLSSPQVCSLSGAAQRAAEDFKLTQWQFLDPFQLWFRLGFGTEIALVSLYDDLCQERDRGNVSLLILLNFSVTFDTINHVIFLKWLSELGMSGTT